MPARRRAAAPLVAVIAAGLSYLGLAFALWWHAWSAGATTHSLCGCGDPALFLWFFQWPATAVAHLHNPLYTTALFHPTGVNLLAQTSVLGLSLPLVPVTWVWGPIAAVNVAATLTPALSAFAMYMVLRRWVQWFPAAYVGGLLFGFSPFVLVSLEFAHFMTAAVMLLPPILAVLDDLCLRHHHDPRRAGLLLGVLVFWQFFLSSEVLAIVAVLAVVSLVAVIGVALVVDRPRLGGLVRTAAPGLAVGMVTAVVLLAYPVWFALDGPAHLSGLLWPRIGANGGFVGSNFITGATPAGVRALSDLGGYGGVLLPSGGYLGWGLIGVVGAGSLLWFRDRRLWFFGFVLAVCVLLSLNEGGGVWVPSRLFDRLPVLENVIEQRFMIVGYLAAAVMLALVMDHARALVGGPAFGLALAALALVPIALTFAPALPFAMEAVVLPRWYSTVAPTLPPGRVLLSYPAPFSGIQVSMAWQALDRMSYSQAGGGGPQSVPARAGPAKGGVDVLTRLAFGIDVPPPTGTAAELAAVRHALAVWRVTTVVIAPPASSDVAMTGEDPAYAAAFMTAVLGRPPRIRAGAWEWDEVHTPVDGPTSTAPGRLRACTTGAPPYPTVRVARCVLAGLAGLAALDR